jgi:hypothetical protein
LGCSVVLPFSERGCHLSVRSKKNEL